MYLAVVEFIHENATITYKLPNGFFDRDCVKTWGVYFSRRKKVGNDLEYEIVLTETPMSRNEFKTFKEMVEMNLSKNIEPGIEYHLRWENHG